MPRFIAVFAAVAALATQPLHARSRRPTGKAKSVDWGGVRLGQTVAAIKKQAKRKRVKLIGPSKSIFDMEKQTFAQTFTVGEGKTLSRDRGIRSQTLYLLNECVVGVDLSYRSRASFENFVKALAEAGYEAEGEGKHVGTIKDGPHKGCKVTVTTTCLKAKRARDRRYVVQVRCIGIVAGPDSKDGAGGTGPDAGNDDVKKAVGRAL